MGEEKLMWQSPCGNAETARDGAGRFVRECFGTERGISWGESPGEFRFPDGMWCYRISCAGGWWSVHRMDQFTPKGKAYTKARREGRRAGGSP